MAQRSQFNQRLRERQLRTFSEDFKRQKVREIEQKISSVSDVSKQYEVSKVSVRRWLLRYSVSYSKGIRTIVESESDTRKLLDLQQKIAELERLVGQKQIQLDFKDKMIDLAEQYYGVDIKKWFWRYREKVGYSLNAFYRATGISKQALHQMLDRRMQACEIEEYVIRLVYDIRKDHPTMSCRAMYFKLRPRHMGRDKFELLCHQLGLTIERKINPFRTTDSTGVVRFDDLLKTAKLTSVDQAYSSDITYFEVSKRFYYLTFILDCFSRRIIGFSVAKRLTTEQTTLPALQMAIRSRGNNLPTGIIFHSDGGGQYYDKEFLKLTSKYQMRNSMCEMAYENGKAERINGVIKNNYLRFCKIGNEEQLLKSVDRAVYLYNVEKPHKGLKYVSPLDFEKQRILLPLQTEPKMTESLEANSDFWGLEPQKIWQTEPQNQDVL